MGLQSSRNMNLADPIIIAGLGGLGGGVIDSLKGKIENDYDDINRVEMRIVDMTSHVKKTHITNDEIIILDPRGTDCDRTLGQSIFRDEKVYEGIRSEFKTLIEKMISIAGEDHINVLIASGIVGGTGGGIFVDFTYMIHDLFRECHHKNYSICAYMFDAESTDDQDEKNQQMKLNGQEALKELQHNMNITTQEHLYHATIGQREITCRKTLFEEYKHISFCLCFLFDHRSNTTKMMNTSLFVPMYHLLIYTYGQIISFLYTHLPYGHTDWLCND